MQADRIFPVRDRLRRRREQRKFDVGAFQYACKLAFGKIAVARHERQFRTHLPVHPKGRPACAADFQEIDGDVGVAAQAVALRAVDHALRDKLGDDVDAARQQIVEGVRVVRRDIVLLRHGRTEPAPRQEEEFVDLDVRRQRLRMQRLGVGELRIAAEQPLDHRIDEAPFELARGPRLLQRQRREDFQLDRWISGCPGKQGVGDVVRLAEPERQAEHDGLADVGDDPVGNRLGAGKALGHAPSTCQTVATGVTGEPTAPVRRKRRRRQHEAAAFRLPQVHRKLRKIPELAERDAALEQAMLMQRQAVGDMQLGRGLHPLHGEIVRAKSCDLVCGQPVVQRLVVALQRGAHVMDALGVRIAAHLQHLVAEGGVDADHVARLDRDAVGLHDVLELGERHGLFGAAEMLLQIDQHAAALDRLHRELVDAERHRIVVAALRPAGSRRCRHDSRCRSTAPPRRCRRDRRSIRHGQSCPTA